MKASQAAEIFKALGNEHRVQIVRQLVEKALDCRDQDRCDLSELCCDVGEIAEKLDIALPTVSYHLKELRNVGLITMQREGRHLYYTVNARLLGQACAHIQGERPVVEPVPDRLSAAR